MRGSSLGEGNVNYVEMTENMNIVILGWSMTEYLKGHEEKIILIIINLYWYISVSC